MCVVCTWNWGLAAVSALVQSACLHGACCHTRLLFRKSLGLFIPPPAWAPAKELQALVYLLVRTSVCGFPAANQPEVRACPHSHACADHVSFHRRSPNPGMSPNPGPGRFTPPRDKDDPSAAPGRQHTNLATPKAPGKCESQLLWPWSCALAPTSELITAQWWPGQGHCPLLKLTVRPILPHHRD